MSAMGYCWAAGVGLRGLPSMVFTVARGVMPNGLADSFRIVTVT